MRLVNRTPYPTNEILQLLGVVFVRARTEPDVVRVRIRARGSSAQGATSPTGRVVLIGLAAEPYPHRAGYRAAMRGLVPGVVLRSWQEELVDIAGHEAYHVLRHGAGGEPAAERLGHRLLRWYRRGA
jgi:hypothetical protein